MIAILRVLYFTYFFYLFIYYFKDSDERKNIIVNGQPDMQLKVRSDKAQDAGKTEGPVTRGLVRDSNNIRCRQE